MAELINIITQIINSKPRDEQVILLPIETINGLPVTAKIAIISNSINYLFFIDVDANGIDVEPDEEPLQLLSKLFFEISIVNPVINNNEFIDTFKKIVNSLRYNNKTGKINEEEEDTQFFRDLILNENITFKEEEQCCVCSEITKTKTQCNHSLCFICWSKIKPNNDVKCCPICRESIYYDK